MNSEAGTYQSIFEALDRVALDPGAWVDVCYGITDLVSATGAVLVPGERAARTLAMPSTESLEGTKQAYVDLEVRNWDIRERGLGKMFATGFMTDFDAIEPEAHARHPYYQEFLAPQKLRWFTGLGFSVEGGAGFGLFAIQGSDARGPFLEADIERLRKVRPAVQLAVRQAELFGWRRIDSARDLLAPSGIHLLTIGWAGTPAPLDEGAARAAGLAGLRLDRRLAHASPLADATLRAALDAVLGGIVRGLPACPPPIRLEGAEGETWIAEIFPAPRDFPSMAIDVAALLALRKVPEPLTDPVAIMGRVYGLTDREAALLRHLADGLDLRQSAERMAIGRETARTHLKSIFAKTDTHRQAELVKLATSGP